ncbi:hypothetical protein CXB37_27720 [Pseudomonas syringae pv. syringae]|nr:hypothetical protein CXB37_27720 [Pseudomonas syringae pv. syringae]
MSRYLFGGTGGLQYGIAKWRERVGFLRSHTFEYVMEWRFDLSGGRVIWQQKSLMVLKPH